MWLHNTRESDPQENRCIFKYNDVGSLQEVQMNNSSNM